MDFTKELLMQGYRDAYEFNGRLNPYEPNTPEFDLYNEGYDLGLKDGNTDES